MSAAEVNRFTRVDCPQPVIDPAKAGLVSAMPGLLPDWQIEERMRLPEGDPRRLVIEHYVEECQDEMVISYGLGSFGYDMRMADQIMIFSDTAATVVDPLNFDDSRFFRDEGRGHYLIPPNSFALARSVERFEIPLDCLVLAIGKSTYARCFPGDAEVLLMDGTSESFRSMADSPDKPRWGFGVRPEDGRYVCTELKAPRWVGREEAVDVTLDDGSVISCTPDHEFMRHGGHYTEASRLRPGDGLVPLYLGSSRGRKNIWIPQLQGWLSCYWLADEWNLSRGVYDDVEGTHRHHKDKNKANDNPTNIERVPAGDHARMHNDEYYGDGFDSDRHGEKVSESLRRLMADPQWRESYSLAQSARSQGWWDDPANVAAISDRNAKIRAAWNGERRSSHGAKMAALWRDDEFRKLQSASRSKSWTPERKAAHAEKMRRYHAGKRGGNHSVVSVSAACGKRDVFCVTSADSGNFALSCGVIARNCGINMNMTPLEPGWRGHVTLEIINGTRLPAKVYAGMGIVQALFFRGIAAPRRHYGNKKRSRYQDQVGITPPRA